jgi:hypothetical protein
MYLSYDNMAEASSSLPFIYLQKNQYILVIVKWNRIRHAFYRSSRLRGSHLVATSGLLCHQHRTYVLHPTCVTATDEALFNIVDHYLSRKRLFKSSSCLSDSSRDIPPYLFNIPTTIITEIGDMIR